MNRSARWMLLLTALAVVAAGACSPEPEPGPTTCEEDSGCPPNQVCEQARCVDCPEILDPVCGEDGETYDSDCLARAARVDVASPGICPMICGGVAGIACPGSEYCDVPAGMCGGVDLEGVCVVTGDVCATFYDPVCGCDGETYSNDCFRQMARVQKDHDGECEGS